ncbi:MAG: hypothetical protein FWC62_03700 [Firmicutes bacterium]|nr:hypothetical protein [Bacillota bacterium]
MPSYNRYNGRTGQMVRVEVPERPEPARQQNPMNRPGRQQSGLGNLGGGLSGLLSNFGLGGKKPTGSLLGLGGELGGFFQKLGLNFNLSELETEDYILMLILFLMYRESGDTELLIALGAMLLT